ncbi:uncharacterized protein LOC141531763 [Cotesia typhae]|uniref:uncharacterized protein LOC141531763 n=1 Tax=Cotesia typhae TaxID=2053667 RepID=UPI003D688348
MSGVSSNTGLIAARVTPVYRTKSKKLELLSIAKPAPFTIRPFAGLFNPFPYGCSVLCNHPADCEAKEFIRRAKESWAMEGKALLLPAEMEMIRATLIAGGIIDSGEVNDGINIHTSTAVPEELFRKYTETDSRPLTPTPTLASGPLTAHQNHPDNLVPCNPRERTTLILDLRTASQEQDETLSWHALTLEPPPSPKRANEYLKSPVQHRHQSRAILPPIQTSDELQDSSRNEEEEDDRSDSDNEVPIRRRGKRLKKRRCRRGSAYGQQNEVRDPLEPAETQVSQVDDTSRRNSSLTPHGNVEVENVAEKIPTSLSTQPVFCSFISPEILKHLAREINRETVEEEFSLKRKIALEEALKMKEKTNLSIKSSSRQPYLQPLATSAPRVFSRQSARFELLNSGSLSSIKPLDYLEKHVFITSGRKLIFGRTFNKYYEDSLDETRCISPNDFLEALREVMGSCLTDEKINKLKEIFGEITEPLSFRRWCGICAASERLLSPLSPKELDPPVWLEKADFEALEKRLINADNVDPQLAYMLRQIRDR